MCNEVALAGVTDVVRTRGSGGRFYLEVLEASSSATIFEIRVQHQDPYEQDWTDAQVFRLRSQVTPRRNVLIVHGLKDLVRLAVFVSPGSFLRIRFEEPSWLVECDEFPQDGV